PFACDVTGDFDSIGQAHASHLAQRRVGLLRRRRIDAGAHAALLRARLKRRHFVARTQRTARIADQLIDRRHRFLSSSSDRTAAAHNPPAAIAAMQTTAPQGAEGSLRGGPDLSPPPKARWPRATYAFVSKNAEAASKPYGLPPAPKG